MRPVLKIYPEIIRKDFLSANAIEVSREGMHQAVTNGSARALSDLPVAVAGKTGTAQTGVQNQSHAWFVGFAPYENPEIAVSIIVENGGEGSSVAVPIAREVLNYYFTRQHK
jgi:cell division protein FtsI/penicillin-binding protein 2